MEEFFNDDPLFGFNCVPVDYQLSFECVPLSHYNSPKTNNTTPPPSRYSNRYSIFETENAIYLPDRKNIQQRQLLIVYVVGADLTEEEAFWQLHYYADNITHVEFNGHIGSNKSVFQILNVLRNVKHIYFNFGANQLQFFSRDYAPERKYEDVQTLSFIMDLQVYDNYRRDENNRMVHLMDSMMGTFLSNSANKMFPNLKKLCIQAPVNNENYESALQLAISSQRLCLGSKVSIDCFDEHGRKTASSGFDMQGTHDQVKIVSQLHSMDSKKWAFKLQAFSTMTDEAVAQAKIFNDNENNFGINNGNGNYNVYSPPVQWPNTILVYEMPPPVHVTNLLGPLKLPPYPPPNHPNGPYFFPPPFMGPVVPPPRTPIVPIPIQRYSFGLPMPIMSPPANISTPQGSPFFNNNMSCFGEFNGVSGSTNSSARDSYYTSSEDDLDFNTGVNGPNESGGSFPSGDVGQVFPHMVRKKGGENRKNCKNGRKLDGFSSNNGNGGRQGKATDRFSKLCEKISHYCTDEDFDDGKFDD